MTHGPDLIAAGFSRCGTTSLYAYFREHPGMWVPPLKEITYWDLERIHGRRSPKRSNRLRFAAGNIRRGTNGWAYRLDDARFLARYAIGRPSDSWYLKLFAPARGRVTADLSPSYMRLDDDQVRELHQALPDTRVLFMLRDPFDRAWSNARKALARGHQRTMDEVPDAEIEALLTDPWFLENCDYVGPLRRWRSIFAEDRLLVGYTADLDQRPDALLTWIAEFIGVSPEPLVEAHGRTSRQFTTDAYGGAIEPRWERLLAEHLQPMLTELAADLGGHAEQWRARGEQALAATTLEH